MTDNTSYMTALLDAINARFDYETAKNADSHSMQKTLADLKKAMSVARIAEVMQAANVDAAFINRAERSNARFNVYAAEKVVNIARTLANVATLNHYTRAIILSMSALEANQLTLTQKDAVAACSVAVKLTDAKRDKMLVKYQKHASANTASTQASSSLNALKTFNMIRESRDDANNAVFVLNESAKELLAHVNI